MRFPLVITFRQHRATVYGKSSSYPYYRLAFHTAGKRVVRSFSTFREAKAQGSRLLREMAKGSQAPSLSPKDAAEMLAIRDRLNAFRRETGRTVSPLEAVTAYLDAVHRLGPKPLSEAIDGFLTTIDTISRTQISDAVEEFIESRRHRSESKNGKRPEMSPVYASNVAGWLREFAATFPGHAVSDLSKQHLDTYVGAFSALSTKSRNDRRNTIKMFLRWCVQRDYLPASHRLFEAVSMKVEKVIREEIDFYRPKEFRALLDAADGPLRPVLALNGLAGLRVEEIFRLKWNDVWRVPGHVEISASIAKGRRRRLVEMCSALEQWLEPFRKSAGPVWKNSVDTFHERVAALREQLHIPSRRNGLRHAYCSFHFALHSNENLTAAMGGNSPTIVHEHYRGLATRAEAQKWFAITPASSPNVIALPKVEAAGA